jgi:hypothetical protein
MFGKRTISGAIFPKIKQNIFIIQKNRGGVSKLFVPFNVGVKGELFAIISFAIVVYFVSKKSKK